MTAFPTGVVTFLFTDIEGSTRLWGAHPTSMNRALERHDELMNAGIAAHGGYVFSTGGDSFSAAFASATEALRAALKIQHDLKSEDWDPAPALKVRMGLHSGEAEVRGGDYFGHEVSRAARLCNAAHGEQILVSGSTKHLISGATLPELAFQDLGRFRLKSMDAPENLYQVMYPGLPRKFPRPRSTAEAHNLPVPLTSFVGREQELATLRSLAAVSRLTTLIGVGGTGKTRLALQLAEELMPNFEDGAWFVDFQAIRDVDLVAHQIGRGLGIREAGHESDHQLEDEIGNRQMLVILDNCEHVIAGVRPTVHLLLEECPRLTILATSRRPLDLDGEQLFHVPPLETPPTSGGKEIDADLFPSVQLFIDRAHAKRHDFEPNAADLESIAQIASRLEGIPLAIELSAGRVTAYTPAEIAGLLEERLDLLVSEKRDAPTQHLRLGDVMDWSYDLMTPDERALFRVLSVFGGAFDLEAVRSIAAGALSEASLLPEALTALVEQSMVERFRRQARSRYRLLDTVRAFAMSKLLESGNLESVRRRQLDYLMGLTREGVSGLQGARQAEWLERLGDEHESSQEVIDWLIESDDPDTALELCSLLWRYWLLAGYLRLGQRRLDESLARSKRTEPEVLADALTGASIINLRLGDLSRATDLINRRLELARAEEDTAGTIDALSAMSGFDHLTGRFDAAEEKLRAALGTASETEDDWRRATVLYRLAMNRSSVGSIEEADELADAAVSIAEAISDDYLVADAHLARGEVRLARGDLDGAAASCERAMQVTESTVFEDQRAWCQLLRGKIKIMSGDHHAAITEFRKAEEVFGDLGEAVGFAIASANLGAARATTQEGDVRDVLDRAYELATSTYTPAEPLVLESMALNRVARGDFPGAEEAMERADNVRETMGTVPGPVEALLRSETLSGMRT